MSSTELAGRMGLVQQAIARLERGEVNETIQLDTLRRAAEALECDLVYALVPRTTLTDSVTTQARRKATALLHQVGHQSRLEDQEITNEELQVQVEDLAARYLDHRGLWS
jgi:predicted DNA-binding mobile mystery protein A